jgi:hypothetical protein
MRLASTPVLARILLLRGPPGVIWEGAAFRRRRSVSTRLDDSFCEGLARDLLERDGPEVVSRLRQEAIAARGEGHRRGAELMIQIADAAERLLRQTSN